MKDSCRSCKAGAVVGFSAAMISSAPRRVVGMIKILPLLSSVHYKYFKLLHNIVFLSFWSPRTTWRSFKLMWNLYYTANISYTLSKESTTYLCIQKLVVNFSAKSFVSCGLIFLKLKWISVWELKCWWLPTVSSEASRVGVCFGLVDSNKATATLNPVTLKANFAQWKSSSNRFTSSVLEGMCGQHHFLAALALRISRYVRTGGWKGLQTDLDRYEESRSHVDLILGRPSSVSLWTTKIRSKLLWHYISAIEEFIIFCRTAWLIH